MEFADIGKTVLFFALDALLYFLIFKILFMWLMRFEVLNARNYYVALVGNTLSAIMAPIYRAVRMVIPAIGGVDLSPIATIVLLIGLRYLLGSVLA